MKYNLKVVTFFFFLLILIFNMIYMICITQDEFSLSQSVDETKKNLKDYENISINDNKIYENVEILINEISNIRTDNNVIINIVNSDSGFGSQLTIIMQTLSFLKEMNPNIICLPHFSKNSQLFKYHDANYNNSFFLYYKRKKDIDNLANYKIYFARASLLLNTPFVNQEHIPTISNEINKKYITDFINEYEVIKNPSITDSITNLKKPIFGIQLRNIAQKIQHDPEYLSLSYSDRLLKIKEKLSHDHDDYSIFIMSDTNDNINLAKSIFDNIYYFDNVLRIDGNTDIISSLDNAQSGYKLGIDILNECLAMSLCNKIFVSNSNIHFIISTMNPDIDMEKY